MGLSTSGCVGCGLVQTWPKPSREALEAFYRNDYRNYYQSTIHPDAAYVDAYGKEERLRYTARLITDIVELAPGACVLDVGCAEGTLFRALSNLRPDLEAIGIEPSPEFGTYARQHACSEVYPDLQALAAAGDASFDLIILNHVLEHAYDPVELLVQVAPFLAPNGRLYIDVPDIDQYTEPTMLHIAHLHHFSMRTLRMTVEKAGMRMIAGNQHAPPHHPQSIWALLARARPGDGAESPWPGPIEERHGWDNVRAIGRRLPVYLLRIRLHRFMNRIRTLLTAPGE